MIQKSPGGYYGVLGRNGFMGICMVTKAKAQAYDRMLESCSESKPDPNRNPEMEVAIAVFEYNWYVGFWCPRDGQPLDHTKSFPKAAAALAYVRRCVEQGATIRAVCQERYEALVKGVTEDEQARESRRQEAQRFKEVMQGGVSDN